MGVPATGGISGNTLSPPDLGGARPQCLEAVRRGAAGKVLTAWHACLAVSSAGHALPEPRLHAGRSRAGRQAMTGTTGTCMRPCAARASCPRPGATPARALWRRAAAWCESPLAHLDSGALSRPADVPGGISRCSAVDAVLQCCSAGCCGRGHDFLRAADAVPRPGSGDGCAAGMRAV